MGENLFMEKDGILKRFAKYASLNVLGMLGLSCYILADTFFVSMGLGANGLAALNLAIPIYSFLHGSGLMLGMGGGTQFAIQKSQNKREAVNRIFTHTIRLAAIFAAVFVLLGLFLTETLVHLLGADEAVFAMTKTYLQVILLFAPAFLLNNVLLCFVRNDGAPQLAMAAMIGGSLSNVVLDYVFIFPLGMGIFGAVLATGLAPLLSMLILSPHFLKKKNTFHAVKCRMEGKESRRIISSGIPSLIAEVSSGIVMIVFNSILLRLQGNIGVAAYGVIANLSLVVLALFTGIAQGIQPILSSSFGAGREREMQSILRYALLSMLVLSGLLYMGVFFGASQIAAIFNSAGDKTLQRLAVEGLRIYFLACPFAGYNIILSVYFTSTGIPRPAHIISILRGFVVILPMALILSSLAGIAGVWSAFPVTELLVAGMGVVFYGVYRKKKGKGGGTEQKQGNE